MSAQPKTPEQIAEVVDNLAKVQSFDPWSAKWISEAHMLLRSIASQPAEQPRGETAKCGCAGELHFGCRRDTKEPPVPAGCTLIDNLELSLLREKASVCVDADRGDLWYWQGDGYDIPESLSCPVVMSAETLRSLIAAQPKPEQDHSRDATKMIEQAVGDGVLSGKYGDVLRPFLTLMDRELHANAGKGDRPGWLAMDRKTALLEIFYHLAKLQKAAKDDDQDGIREYGADVANMAMMLVDVCGALDVTPRPAVATPAEVTDGGIKRYRIRIVPDDSALDGVVADTVEDARGDLVTYADHCAALASPRLAPGQWCRMGWKLVPLTLTDAMREAWMEAACTADAEWEALLAAAPEVDRA